jgi:hypothetical protein
VRLLPPTSLNARSHPCALYSLVRTIFKIQDSWSRPFYPEDSPVLSACRAPQLSAMTP